MFGLFKKKEINREAAASFWDWFCAHEAAIIHQIEISDSTFIWAIDDRLKPVFPYFHKELEFLLGFQDGSGEFFFCHFENPFLRRDAQIWADLKPQSLSHWTIHLEK